MTSAVEPGDAPRDALICGIAVTTIGPSRFSMKKHAATRSATLRSPGSIIEGAAKHKRRARARADAASAGGRVGQVQHPGAEALVGDELEGMGRLAIEQARAMPDDDRV